MPDNYSTLGSFQLTYEKLRTIVATFAGWPPDSTTWGQARTDQFEQILEAGLRNFYWPPALSSDEQPHVWSFLRPNDTIVTVSGQRFYTLPLSFDHIIGDLTYGHGENDYYSPISVTSDQRLRAMETQTNFTSFPQWAAVRPKHSDSAAPQFQEIGFHPTPDAAYELNYRYHAIPVPIGPDNPYPLGGAVHGQTIIEAILHQAALTLDDDSQDAHAVALQRALRTSVTMDQQRGAELIGYNGDGSDMTARSRRLAREGLFNSEMTYNGVTYGG